MLNNFRRVLLTVGVVACLVATPAGAKAPRAPAHAQESATGDKTATPVAQALKIYRALRDQDYKAMFYLTAFTVKGKATLTTAEQFALDLRKGYESGFKTPEEKAVTDRIYQSITEIMIGEPVITDGKAVIPTSAKITVNDQTRTFKGLAHLIQDSGVWKLDLTFDEDSEKATAQRVSELIGSPEKTP